MATGNYTLEALNAYLFEQIDALSNPDLNEEELMKEIKRSDAISKAASVIVQGASVTVRAMALKAEYGDDNVDTTALLGSGK